MTRTKQTALSETKQTLQNAKGETNFQLADLLNEEPILVSKTNDIVHENKRHYYINRSYDGQIISQSGVKSVDDIDSNDYISPQEKEQIADGLISKVAETKEKSIIVAAKIIASSNKELGEATITSGYIVSKAILYASQNISYAFQQLTDEIERKNKLDEFYMLLDKIDEYEGKLIEWKCIKEAYENMSLVRYPTFEVDERMMYIVVSMGDVILNQIIDISLRQQENPVRVLFDFLSKAECYGVLANSSHTGGDLALFLGGKGSKYIRLPWKVTFNQEGKGSVLNQSVKVVDGLKVSTFDELDRRYYKNDNERLAIYQLKVKDAENFVANLIRTTYNMIKDNELFSMKFNSDEYKKLVRVIETINRERQLSNLRGLCLNLRNAVREYRIKSVMGNS